MSTTWIFLLVILTLIALPMLVFFKLMVAYYTAQAILEEDNREGGDSSYNRSAAEDSWDELTQFFHKHLQLTALQN